MREPSRDKLVAYVHSSMGQVFSTMLNLVAEPGAPHSESGEPEAFDGITALVGIAGEWTGTGRLLCSPHLARKLAGNLLMSTFLSVDEEVLDAIAEIANMVVGNVKTLLEEDLGPLCLSVPTVISGEGYRTRSAGMHDWLVLPFRCGEESIEFRFCLMPTPATPHAGFGLELHQS